MAIALGSLFEPAPNLHDDMNDFASAVARRSMGGLSINLDVLSAAERRDLANALLRAAWSAVLQETRIALPDLIVEVDDTILGGAA